MKQGLVGGIQRFSTEDGPGVRTTVFFKGCPLKCKWCHNPDLIDYRPEVLHYPRYCIKCGNCIKACPVQAIDFFNGEIRINREKCQHCGKCAENCYTDGLKLSGEPKTVEEIMKKAVRDKGFYDKTGGGVTLSGGEVTSHADFAYEVVQACKKKKLGVAIDTCGHCSYENLEKLCRDAKTILYDIKCIDSDRHKELTGVGNELIIENLKRLAADPDMVSKIIIRMPLIHPINDSLEDMEEICNLLSGMNLREINGIPYHNMGLSKTRGLDQEVFEYETPTDEHLDEIAAVFHKHDLPFTIMGRD